MKSDYRDVILNLVWGIVGGVLSYLVNFLLTPYITNHVGIEAYGFVSLGNTLITYINIAAIGLNSFAARFVAVCYHKKKYDEANTVYSSVLIANIILSAVVIFICVPLIYQLENFLDIPSILTLDVKILFVFILFNYLVNLFVGVISIISFINNKIRITLRIKAFTAIVYTVFIILFFTVYDVNIAYIGVSNFIASVLGLCLLYFSSLRVDDKIFFSLKKWSFKRVKTILDAGIFNSINSLGGTLGSGLDLLIANKLLDVMAMGQIAVGNQLGTLVNLAVSLVSNVFQPKQLEAYSKNDINALVNQLKFAMKVCGFVGLSFLIVFISVGGDFLLLWIPGQKTETIYYIALIVFVGNAIVSIVTPLYYVSTLTLKVKPVCVITLICGILNVSSMLIFIPYNIVYGAYIVVATTAFLDIAALLLFPILCEKYLNLSCNPFWGVIIKFLFLMLFFSITALLVSKNVYSCDWINLSLYSMVIEGMLMLGYGSVMLESVECKKIIMYIYGCLLKK